MILKELLKGVTYTELKGCAEREISGLTYDSRTVSEGYCFFAVSGTVVDGHNFIAKAIESGAKAVVCERIPEEVADLDCTFVVVEDSNLAMGVIASNSVPTKKVIKGKGRAILLVLWCGSFLPLLL